MRELKKINGRFTDKPAVGDLFVSEAAGGRLIPRYKVIKVNKKTVRLEGVDRELDFTVFIRENARNSFKRIEQTLERVSAVNFNSSAASKDTGEIRVKKQYHVKGITPFYATENYPYSDENCEEQVLIHRIKEAYANQNKDAAKIEYWEEETKRIKKELEPKIKRRNIEIQIMERIAKERGIKI